MARNYNKIKNLENDDSKFKHMCKHILGYTWLKENHVKSCTRTKHVHCTKAKGVSSEFKIGKVQTGIDHELMFYEL